MIVTHIIIDNFYEDPLAVRDLALTADYQKYPGSTYPGENSVKPYFPRECVNKLRRILGKPFHLRENYNGHFRISPEGSDHQDEYYQDIHIDPGIDWGGVLYLNPDQEDRAGTLFWKHKKTGLSFVPDKGELKKIGIQDLRKDIVYGDGRDRSKWEIQEVIPMKFNRLVLFKANRLFHSHGENFGKVRENSRLVQLFFLLEGLGSPQLHFTRPFVDYV